MVEVGCLCRISTLGYSAGSSQHQLNPPLFLFNIPGLEKFKSDMVTGIEVAGLALAILPLFVSQIDAYVRGIEKIKGLRGYRRELRGYSVGLSTQHAILLNTLEQALEGVVEDEDQVAELIRNPQGDGWKDPELQKRLRRKLDRNYEVFMGNMNGLSESLERLSHKLDIGVTDIKVSILAFLIPPGQSLTRSMIPTDIRTRSLEYLENSKDDQQGSLRRSPRRNKPHQYYPQDTSRPLPSLRRD